MGVLQGQEADDLIRALEVVMAKTRGCIVEETCDICHRKTKGRSGTSKMRLRLDGSNAPKFGKVASSEVGTKHTARDAARSTPPNLVGRSLLWRGAKFRSVSALINRGGSGSRCSVRILEPEAVKFWKKSRRCCELCTRCLHVLVRHT